MKTLSIYLAIQLLEKRLALKKSRQKHGGFRPLLTLHGSLRLQVFTTDQPRC